MAEVTDPDLLNLLNAPALPPAPSSPKIGPQEKKLRQMLNAEDLPRPEKVTWQGGPMPADVNYRTPLSPKDVPSPTTLQSNEITDPKLLSQLNEGSTKPFEWSAENLAKEVPGAVASIGHGVIEGGTALAGAPWDISNALKQWQGRQPDPNLGSDAIRRWLKENGPEIYQPQGRIQKDISAAGSAIPLTLATGGFGGVPMALSNVGGSALGEEATNWDMFKGVPKDVVRVAGNVAFPAAGEALVKALPLAAMLLHAAHPTAGTVAKGALNAAKDFFSKSAVRPEAIPSAEELYAMGQTGEKSASELEKIAIALRQKLWGPDQVEPNNLPKLGPFGMETLSRLLKFGMLPEMQQHTQ